MPSEKESVMAATETTRHPQVFMRPGEVFDEPPPLYSVNNLLDKNLPKPNYQTPKPQIHHHGTYSPSRVKTPAPNPTVGPKLPFEQPEVISRTRFEGLSWRQKAHHPHHPKKLSSHPPLSYPVSLHPKHPTEVHTIHTTDPFFILQGVLSICFELTPEYTYESAQIKFLEDALLSYSTVLHCYFDHPHHQ